MDTYKIVYLESGVIQYKVMIEHENYLKIKSIKDDDEFKYQLKLLTNGKEWFTNKSTFYDAIENGLLKLYNGNYSKVVIIKMLD